MKKLSINTLALGNLKQRKKQYSAMIIGIIIAMFFSSGMLFFANAMQDSKQAMRENRFGRQDVLLADVNQADVHKLIENGILRQAGFAHIIGSVANTNKDALDTVRVGRLDETAAELSNIKAISGRLPTAKGEIAIERIALARLEIKAQPGEMITLRLFTQNGSKTFSEYTEKTYKLVGILQNKASYISFISAHINEDEIPSAFVSSEEAVEPGGKESLACYAMLNSTARKQAYSLFNELPEFEKFSIITAKDVAYINDSSFHSMENNILFSAILVCVLMLSSCIAVVNAFNSNLKERKKQIGLLRAVGTTRRQIINIYCREAIIISLICAPVSCSLSFFAVKLLMRLLGEDYVLHAHPISIAVALCFSILSIAISATIPLFSASKITPVQAIRDIEKTRRMNIKGIKSQRSFSPAALLARRGMANNRLKMIVVSIFMIITIAGTGFLFSWYTYNIKQKLTSVSDYSLIYYPAYYSDNGIIYKNQNKVFTESDRQKAELNEYITESIGIKNTTAHLIDNYEKSVYRQFLSNMYESKGYDDNSISSENYRSILFPEKKTSLQNEQLDILLKTAEHSPIKISAMDIMGLEQLKSKVFEGRINLDKIASGEEIILAAARQIVMFQSEGKNSGIMIGSDKNFKGRLIFNEGCDFHAGDEVEIAFVIASRTSDSEESNNDLSNLSDAKIIRKKFKIGAIVDELDLRVKFYTTLGVLDSIASDCRYDELRFNLNTTITPEIDKYVLETLEGVSENVESSSIHSDFATNESIKKSINNLLIISLSIMIMLSFISISIINNTITASIRSSKQKIGTLRAVGADARELAKAYTYQLLSMLLWGSVTGQLIFNLGFLVARQIYHSRELSFEMSYNPLISILFTLVSFAICIANLQIKLRREMKNSIVENIREL